MRRMTREEKIALVRGADQLSIGPIDRLGVPALTAVAGVMGVSAKDAAGRPILATAFPANIGMGATWNAGLLEKEGAVIAAQAGSLGRGQVIGPLTEMIPSPLSGRAFESYGEDPWLVSRLVAGFVSGVQGEGEIATAVYGGDLKATRAAREFDQRPLEAAVTEGGAWAVTSGAVTSGAVTTGALGGHPGNSAGDFLRKYLGFRGFATVPGAVREPINEETDREVHAVLRAMFSSGLFDRERKTGVVRESAEQRTLARSAAAQSIVLLKNEGGLLPLDPKTVRSIAVLGPNAAVHRMAGGNYTVAARYSEPPLDALRTIFGSGVHLVTSPEDARKADAAIVFAGTGANSEAETTDRSSLNLPPEQEDLIAAVAKANPRTIVVLIAGFPVETGRWIGGIPAVLDAWFPGEEGGHAIADVLTGAVNPSGRLPVGFPGEIFPFGYGLSYTQFEYSDLAVLPAQVPAGQFVEVSLTVRNTGPREGKETVQLYLRAKGGGAGKLRGMHLCGIQQVDLKPGEATRARFTLMSDAMARFDEEIGDWVQDQGVFEVLVGASSADIRATGTISVTE